MAQPLCSRCTRQSLRWHLPQSRRELRRLSSSTMNQAGYRDLSVPLGSNGSAGPPKRENFPSPPKPQPAEGRSSFGAMIDRVQEGKQTRSTGLLRRTGPSTARGSGSPRGQISTRGRGGVPGQLLIRRTSSPGGDSRSPASAFRGRGGMRGARGGARGGGRGSARDGGRTPPRKREDADADDMTPEEEAEISEKIWGPTGISKEHIVYQPRDTTLEDLRADWPNTPLSTIGLAESVQQKIEVLADRIPHGYKAPVELAERYQAGEFVRFESREEKEKVLSLAKELARVRADSLTERKGENVPVEDMTFTEIKAKEKHDLVAKMVQGIYPELTKQRIPFLDTVYRNLRNNGTYAVGTKQEQFMLKIQSLLPQNTGVGKGARTQQKNP